MWKKTLLDIYNSTKPENYYKTIWYQEISKWNREKILNSLKMAHENGFLGIHFINGRWSSEMVETYLKELFEGEIVISSNYCEKHNKTFIYINPSHLDIKDIKELKYSYTNENELFGDFCFEPII